MSGTQTTHEDMTTADLRCLLSCLNDFVSDHGAHAIESIKSAKNANTALGIHRRIMSENRALRDTTALVERELARRLKADPNKPALALEYTTP